MREYPGGQPQQADGGAAAQPLDLHSSTANLTQELAQLLAQSIAQGQSQGGKHTQGAAATGSEFANLAALVSTATQTQRSHQPSFRDGLSSLSYARPAQPIAPPPPPVLAPPAPSLVAPPVTSIMTAPSSNGLLVSEPHDEEPMPIPSTWRQPTLGDDERWYRQQLGAAGLGLLAGLVVVVPAVLWLSGFLGGSQTRAVTRQEVAQEGSVPAVQVAEVKTVKVTTATLEPRITVTPAAAAVERFEQPVPEARTTPVADEPPVVALPRVAAIPPPMEPVQSRADQLLAQAQGRIESGDIAGARDILLATEADASAPMTFLLAETYDPNMLASWQTRGVTANPERARALYQRARELGDSRAQQRIEWLTGN